VQTDRRSSSFNIERGAKQGDPVSPILSNAVLEQLMRAVKAKWKLKKYGFKIDEGAEDEFINNLRYADDILLMARSLPQLRNMLADIDREAKKVGLTLHPEKTKIQHNGIGYGAGVKSAKCGDITVEVLPTDAVTTYLGRSINLRAMDDTEVNARIRKAWSKFGVYRGELIDTNIPIHLRMKLFEAVITPTVLYGCEAWTMTAKRQMSLRTAQRKMVRCIMNAHRTYQDFDNYVDWMKSATAKADHLMNVHNVTCWTKVQRRRMWNWAGKMAAEDDGRWNTAINKWQPCQTRPKGRPRTRWSDALNAFLARVFCTSFNGKEWVSKAKQTKEWQEMGSRFVEEMCLNKADPKDSPLPAVF